VCLIFLLLYTEILACEVSHSTSGCLTAPGAPSPTASAGRQHLSCPSGQRRDAAAVGTDPAAGKAAVNSGELQPPGHGRGDLRGLLGGPLSPAPTHGVLWVPPRRCLPSGLAEVRVGGRRADGADVAAGAAAGDEVSGGPVPGQGTHRAARRVAVDEGEVQPVGAGRADGTLRAVEREPRVSPSGSCSSPSHPTQAPAPTKSTFTTGCKGTNVSNSNK